MRLDYHLDKDRFTVNVEGALTTDIVCDVLRTYGWTEDDVIAVIESAILAGAGKVVDDQRIFTPEDVSTIHRQMIEGDARLSLRQICQILDIGEPMTAVLVKHATKAFDPDAVTGDDVIITSGDLSRMFADLTTGSTQFPLPWLWESDVDLTSPEVHVALAWISSRGWTIVEPHLQYSPNATVNFWDAMLVLKVVYVTREIDRHYSEAGVLMQMVTKLVQEHRDAEQPLT